MGKVRTLAAGAALAVTLGVVASPTSATMQGEGEGCTPGFWKNNTGAWIDPPLIGSDTPLSSLFNVSAYPQLASATMLDALSFTGGSGLEGKISNLLRIATASWLNAVVEISYPLTRTQVVNQVNAAIASGDGATITALQAQLDYLNNQECPLEADEAAK
jgi:hypothetical protein